MTENTQLGVPKWMLTATGVLGLTAAIFVVVTRYYEVQKARVEAERAQGEASTPRGTNQAATDPRSPVNTPDPTKKVDADPGQKMRPGLLVREYPRHQRQMGESGFIDILELGEPIGDSYVARTLNEWKYTENRNAVASGFLKIGTTGEYAFASDNYYDRNTLYIDNRLVCGFRDFDGPVAKIQLKAGLVSIQSVGYVGARGSVRVTWKPPSEREMMDIPQELLSHQESELPK